MEDVSWEAQIVWTPWRPTHRLCSPTLETVAKMHQGGSPGSKHAPHCLITMHCTQRLYEGPQLDAQRAPKPAGTPSLSG
jgi:hypothetical protein